MCRTKIKFQKLSYKVRNIDKFGVALCIMYHKYYLLLHFIVLKFIIRISKHFKQITIVIVIIIIIMINFRFDTQSYSK